MKHQQPTQPSTRLRKAERVWRSLSVSVETNHSEPNQKKLYMSVTASEPAPLDTDFSSEEVSKYENGLRMIDQVLARVEQDQLSHSYEPNKVVNGSIQGDLQFAYGTPPSVYKGLVDACKAYSWKRTHELVQNMGNHLRIKIHGNEVFQGSVDIHVVHRKTAATSKRKGVIMLVHGWPGSFLEFSRVAPLLDDQGYDLVVPSLPGYTYSSSFRYDGPYDKSPWTLEKCAICLHATMQKLGYQQYFAQGGDWGSMVVRSIAHLYPENCGAIHLNLFMFSTEHLPDQAEMASLSDNEKLGLTRMKKYSERGQGYAILQGTTPYTLGASLSAHPLSALLYLSEKWFMGSDKATRPTLDEIIGTTALYWLNNRITSSFWLYYNYMLRNNGDMLASLKAEITVPTSVCFGRKEMFWPPRSTAEKTIRDLRSWKQFPRGGHFAASEIPELFAEDVGEFFGQFTIEERARL